MANFTTAAAATSSTTTTTTTANNSAPVSSSEVFNSSLNISGTSDTTNASQDDIATKQQPSQQQQQQQQPQQPSQVEPKPTQPSQPLSQLEPKPQHQRRTTRTASADVEKSVTFDRRPSLPDDRIISTSSSSSNSNIAYNPVRLSESYFASELKETEAKHYKAAGVLPLINSKNSGSFHVCN
jgi:hypothetical protein